MASTTAAPSTARDLLALTPNDVKAMSRREMLATLRDISTAQQQRCPALTLQLCMALLRGSVASLGDDVHTVREQALIASLECGNVDLALQQHGLLAASFGKKSVRVRKLMAMIHEAAGRADTAVAAYQAILKDAPGDGFAVKRLSAMRKAAGDIAGAIELLEQHHVYVDEDKRPMTFCDLHSLDLSALRELGALNLRIGNVDRAVHYAEEALLVEPHLYLNHVRLAEMYYAQGRLEQAAVSYAHALRLNDGANCARSLYGLLLATQGLKKPSGTSRGSKGSSSSGGGGDAAGGVSQEMAAELNAWAAARLRTLYTGSALAASLDLVLAKQQ